jgi:geranylgeranyl diphosphate synthase type 3
MGTTKWDIYVNKEKYFVVKTMYNFLYSRFDNMQDISVLRRGVPATHTIYGVPSTINAANYAHFLALNRLLLGNVIVHTTYDGIVSRTGN